jgi:hypothetical protein
MSKGGKIVAGLVTAAVAVVAILVIVVFQNLDSIIKQVIEGVGTQVTQTRVSVSGVAFSISDGRGEIDGLSIGNPPGYQSKTAFDMNRVVVQVDPRSLTGGVIVIKEVTIDGAQLTAEQKGLKNNLQDLLANIEEAGGGQAAEPAPAESGGSDVRLMLERFAFTNSAAAVITEQWGEQTLKIPDITMANIGDRETGLTPEQLAGRMVESLVKQTEKAVANHLEQLAKDAAKEEINRQIDKKIGAEDRKKLEGLKGLMKKEG